MNWDSKFYSRLSIRKYWKLCTISIKDFLCIRFALNWFSDPFKSLSRHITFDSSVCDRQAACCSFLCIMLRRLFVRSICWSSVIENKIDFLTIRWQNWIQSLLTIHRCCFLVKIFFFQIKNTQNAINFSQYGYVNSMKMQTQLNILNIQLRISWCVILVLCQDILFTCKLFVVTIFEKDFLFVCLLVQ